MTTCITPTTYLDDSTAFAHELYSRLGNGELPIMAAFDAAFAAYEGHCTRLRSLVPGQPEALAVVDTLENLGLDLAMHQYHAGIAFGAAAEHLRQTLLAGRDDPSFTARTNVSLKPGSSPTME